MALTEMQERFCLAYLQEGSPKRAYVKAGYSLKGAKQNAYLLMRHQGVRERIAEFKTQQERTSLQTLGVGVPEPETCTENNGLVMGATQEAKTACEAGIATGAEVLSYLTDILRGHTKGGLEGEEVSLRERMKAAELLGKRHGIFVERSAETNTRPVMIVDDVPKPPAIWRSAKRTGRDAHGD